MTNDARIRTVGLKAYWTCPNCDRTIGEIVGVRLVIIVKRERVLNFPLRDDLEMSCHRCGHVSVYRRDGKAGAV